MNLTINIGNSMIDNLMSVVTSQSVVGEQRISLERGASLNMLSDFTLQHGLLPVGYDGGANLATTLKNADYSNFVFGSSASDTALALGDVHVTGLAADEGFVYFNSATIGAPEFHHGTVLHGLADAVKHEPCGLLSNAKSTGQFARANAILGTTNYPDGGEPLIQSERRVLKDGSHLGSELPFDMGALALPFLLTRQPSNINATTGGASDPIGPAVSDHVSDAVIGIREINHCFLEGLWRFHVLRVSNLS
jgi:hypothetical protein